MANIAVINKCEHIFLYFFLISFFLHFQIFQETFRKLCCGKLSKFPETFLETSGNCLEVCNPSPSSSVETFPIFFWMCLVLFPKIFLIIRNTCTVPASTIQLAQPVPSTQNSLGKKYLRTFNLKLSFFSFGKKVFANIQSENSLFKLAFPLEFSPILSSDCLPGFDSCFSLYF